MHTDYPGFYNGRGLQMTDAGNIQKGAKPGARGTKVPGWVEGQSPSRGLGGGRSLQKPNENVRKLRGVGDENNEKNPT